MRLRWALSLVERRRMAVLLAALVLLIVAGPVADVFKPARFVIDTVSIVFLSICLQQAGAHPRLRIPAIILVGLWILLKLSSLWVRRIWVDGLETLILASVVLIVLGLVARHITTAKRVDAELLCGALGAYMLLGVLCSLSYELIDLWLPLAFTGLRGGASDRGALLYFSFTTLTTVGFGDITATNPVVRMWVALESERPTIRMMSTVTNIACAKLSVRSVCARSGFTSSGARCAASRDAERSPPILFLHGLCAGELSAGELA